MIEVKAPNDTTSETGNIRLFLGGSIDMGTAEKWQDKVVRDLSSFSDLTILNPRRDDWDSSWKQEKNDPQFREQVTWELLGQEDAHVIIYYFAKDSQAPITLMELGLFAQSSAFINVYCPEGFYRKGNVDIVCEYIIIPVSTTYDDLIKNVKTTLTSVYGLQENK